MTQVFAASPLGREREACVALAVGGDRVEPIGVCPWPNPEGSGIWFVKNWIRNVVVGRLFRVPWTDADVPPPMAGRGRGSSGGRSGPSGRRARWA